MSNSVTRSYNDITLTTGGLARQASASVIATIGSTTVLCTVTNSHKKSDYTGFTNLSVHFIAKCYAFGRIPQNFPRREGKPNEQEIIISRIIDRSIRPLFPEGHCIETQIHCILLSYAKEHSPLLASVIGSSAALILSGIKIKPVTAVMIGKINDEYVVNPTYEQLKLSTMEFVMSTNGTKTTMIECEAKNSPVEDIKNAVKIVNQNAKPLIELIDNFVNDVRNSNANIARPAISSSSIITIPFLDELRRSFEQKLEDSLKMKNKYEKRIEINKITEEAIEQFASGEDSAASSQVILGLKQIKREILKNQVFNHNRRIDGRQLNEIRQLDAEIDFIKNVHGSALFTRGDTQALSIVTIGYPQEEQTIDFLGHEERASFLFHYNFPSFAVGEISSPRAPNRREIGHGKLAYKALKNTVPKKAVFPCTIRLVSEITESDGSSSMASVVSATLALMSAGIQIETHVAGIAMGLVCNNEDYKILTDISGDEDDAGFMDFKFAGTRTGVTAIQMDVKNDGVSEEQISIIIDQALEGINCILKKMEETIQEPRQSLSFNAPKIIKLQIDKNKIKDVIGSQGRTIKSICEQTLVKIDVTPDGAIIIAGTDSEMINLAKCKIEDISEGPQYNKVYKGVITKILSFGVMVNFCENKQGLIHASNLPGVKTTDIAKLYPEGMNIDVQLDSIDQMNRYGLKLANTNPAIDSDNTTNNSNEGCNEEHSQDGEQNQTTSSIAEGRELTMRTRQSAYRIPSDYNASRKIQNFRTTAHKDHQFCQKFTSPQPNRNNASVGNNGFRSATQDTRKLSSSQANTKLNKSSVASKKKHKKKSETSQSNTANESNWFF